MIINLTQGYQAIVDNVDSDLAHLNWCAHYSKFTDSYYADSRHSGKLHVVIMERLIGRKLISGELVDHYNGDTLDNRRDNLRIATSSQNKANMNKPKTNTSGYKGVSWHKPLNKWRVQIKVMGVSMHIGYFNDVRDAANAYNDKAYELFGEYARLNVIE